MVILWPEHCLSCIENQASGRGETPACYLIIMRHDLWWDRSKSIWLCCLFIFRFQDREGPSLQSCELGLREREHTFLLRQNQYEDCFHACLQDQVNHKCILLQDNNWEYSPKSMRCSEISQILLLNPSLFQISLLISPSSPSRLTDWLSALVPLSACLPLLAYPTICLPACPSTCLPVCCSSLDKTPTCCCLMKPTTREMRSRRS